MAPAQRVQYWGLVVALSAFGITRSFVAETLQAGSTLPFLISGLIPLVVGLVLAVYGVALALGPFSPEYVRTVARWHLLGVASMIVVFAITSVDQFLRGEYVGFGHESTLLVANVLLGGAVGGTLTGMRSGKALQRRREIGRSMNRALLVNRLLRHEVLNSAAIIGGHADLLGRSDDPRSDSLAAIDRAVRRIDSTIENVGSIISNGDRTKLDEIVDDIRDVATDLEAEHDVEIEFANRVDETDLSTDRRMLLVVRELLENAAAHSGGEPIRLELEADRRTIELSITDRGSGLPEPQRRLLEEGEFPEFDDPTAGFGLQIVRLLVDQFGGTIRVREVPETGTRIAILLPRNGETEPTPETIGLTFPNLRRSVLAGILAGIGMGVFYQLSTGLLPVIGSLYAVESLLVGWITHLFHSAIFGLLFAAIHARPRVTRIASGTARSGLLGIGWATVLWFLAAGLIMPVWLSFLGVPTEIPNLSIDGFVGHAIWGLIVGVTYAGYSDLR